MVAPLVAREKSIYICQGGSVNDAVIANRWVEPGSYDIARLIDIHSLLKYHVNSAAHARPTAIGGM